MCCNFLFSQVSFCIINDFFLKVSSAWLYFWAEYDTLGDLEKYVKTFVHLTSIYDYYSRYWGFSKTGSSLMVLTFQMGVAGKQGCKQTTNERFRL